MPGLPADDLPQSRPGCLFRELVIFLHPPPGRRDSDQPGQRHRPGRPAPVKRQLAGVAVPPDQQHAAPALVPVRGIVAGHLEHRPVVVAGALGPGAGAHPVPGAGGDHGHGPGGGHGAARADGHSMVDPDCHHVAHLVLADGAAQLAAAVHFVAGDEGGVDPQGVRAVEQGAASCGLVANMTSSGTPASSRCSSSAAQAPGRYSARPISACPRPVA